VGGVGLLPDIAKVARARLAQEDDVLILIGAERGHLGQSLYQELAQGKTEGAPPPIDLDAELCAGNLVRRLIREGEVSAVHDISDGGLLVAIAEMALSGGMGAELDAPPQGLPAHAVWFGEDQGRYVVAAARKHAARILRQAEKAAVPARIVGRAKGRALKLPGEAPLSLDALKSRHEGWLPGFMSGG
jgi:phosphoribosylformylglycinamidine synthase